MTRVKVCGLTRRTDAELALELGASALGVIFAPSPRRISTEDARALFEGLCVSSMPVGPTGVFVGAQASEDWPAARGFLRAIQAHGDEPPEFLAEIEGWIRIKAVRVASEADLAEMDRFANVADYFLLDAKVSGRSGGTGISFDWGLLEGRSFPKPIFLAGGLTPDNVGEAIRRVRPFGVDAASGTESAPGKKDPTKLKEFFAAVREADRAFGNQQGDAHAVI